MLPIVLFQLLNQSLTQFGLYGIRFTKNIENFYTARPFKLLEFRCVSVSMCYLKIGVVFDIFVFIHRMKSCVNIYNTYCIICNWS